MPLTSGELAGVPPRTLHRGTLRARPPLTLCRSRPSPQRPPGLRSPAAGVGVGGAGRGCGREGCPQAGRTKASLASQRPIQRSAALPPPLPLPARSLKAERRARLSSGSRRGTGNDLSRFQPPTSPHRWALPRGGGARGAVGSPGLQPQALCGGRTSCCKERPGIYSTWDPRRMRRKPDSPPQRRFQRLAICENFNSREYEAKVLISFCLTGRSMF